MRKKRLIPCLALTFAFLTLCSFRLAESPLAHHYLDGLWGLEIGGSNHNPFGLNTLNVDYTDDYSTIYKLNELNLCGSCMKVDIVSPGDNLPFMDQTVDFVISSHVIEHFYDPIKAIKEWLRVVKPGGYVFIVAPHKERTFDRDRPRTTLAELLQRHQCPIDPATDDHHHWSVWITQDFLEICRYFNWNVVDFQDIDDKASIGFTIVIQKPF